MLFMILLGLSLAPTSFAAPPGPVNTPSQRLEMSGAIGQSRKDCPGPTARMADQKGQGPRARRLDELPSGRLEYAVFREVGGCAIPAVVHQAPGQGQGPE